jgi:hypothetical protein
VRRHEIEEGMMEEVHKPSSRAAHVLQDGGRWSEAFLRRSRRMGEKGDAAVEAPAADSVAGSTRLTALYLLSPRL